MLIAWICRRVQSINNDKPASNKYLALSTRETSWAKSQLKKLPKLALLVDVLFSVLQFRVFCSFLYRRGCKAYECPLHARDASTGITDPVCSLVDLPFSSLGACGAKDRLRRRIQNEVPDDWAKPRSLARPRSYRTSREAVETQVSFEDVPDFGT